VHIQLRNIGRRGEDKLMNLILQINVIKGKWKISEIENYNFEYILNEFLKPIILTGLAVLVLIKI